MVDIDIVLVNVNVNCEYYILWTDIFSTAGVEYFNLLHCFPLKMKLSSI